MLRISTTGTLCVSFSFKLSIFTTRPDLRVDRTSGHLWTSYPGQLSLAIPPWVGSVSVSESWAVNRYISCSGGSREGPQSHDHLKKSCESKCRRDSVFRLWQWLNFSRIHYRGDNVQYPLLQKLQRLWSSHSQPGMSEWADILKVWTWTYYSAEANTQMGRRMRQNTHFETKNWFFFWGGVTLPNGERDTLPIPHPRILSALAAPLFLRLWRSTWPPNPNLGSGRHLVVLSLIFSSISLIFSFGRVQ